MNRFWLGQIGWREVLADEDVRLSGPRWARRALPRWLDRSPFADVERPSPRERAAMEGLGMGAPPPRGQGGRG